MPKVTKTDQEWREQLSDLAYKVTRQHGTERAFTHDNFPKTKGMFHCVCCDAPLFKSDNKFDSGTGWPSFYQPADGADIEEREDRSFFMRRTEVLCENCDAHLGHVFPDGPKPTGLRYCINGVTLNFKSEEG
ncbi:MAG: peptide-methionine (R)-S-oxide reductase MsrB [Pseudomonadota bacterium]